MNKNLRKSQKPYLSQKDSPDVDAVVPILMSFVKQVLMCLVPKLMNHVGIDRLVKKVVKLLIEV